MTAIKDRIKGFRRVPVGQLRANPRNWRTHPEAQRKALRGVLDEIGFANAVLARELGDGTLELIDGHLRLETMAGADEIPTLILDVDEHEADKLLLTLDPLAAMAGTDKEMLAGLFESTAFDDDALAVLIAEATGYELDIDNDERDGEDAEPQIDKAEELRAKWGVESGQLWRLGEHRLLCGDSTKDASSACESLVQLVVTDPPYGVSYADKNLFLNSIDKGNRNQRQIVNDHSTKDETQSVWRAAFCGMSSVMSPGAVVYCFMPQGGDQMMMMMMMMMEAGIEPKHELIWLKNNHVLGRVDYAYKHEPIMYAWKAGGHKFYGDFQTSVLEFARPQKSELHPTMKPVNLVERLIENSSRQGEFVYEPFSGSGTTIIACENLGRKCRAIEISPAYVAVAIQRWADHTGKTPELVR